MRFWRYVILGIVSGTLGILISASQDKLNFNLIINIILIFGLIGIVISVKRIDFLMKKYYDILKLLEKEN